MLAFDSIRRWAVGDVVERVTRVDDRAQRARIEQRNDLGDEPLTERHLAFERAVPQRGADPGDPPAEDQADVDRGVCRRPSGRPARSCRRAAVACRLRSTSSPPITSSTTSTPSGTAAAQFAEPVGRAAFEHEIGTELAARLGLARRAGDGDSGTDRLGDLDRRRADTGRTGVDERPAARREPALHDQRVPRGEEHLGDRRRVGGVDRRRDRHRLTAVGDDPLGVAAAGLDAHHPVADRPVRHRRRRSTATVPAYSMPGNLDVVADAGRGTAPSVGGCRRGSSAVCATRDQDLVRAGNRLVDVLDRQDLGPTVGSKNDGTHGREPTRRR